MIRKSAAILTIYRASDMTTKGKKDIANWLMGQAAWLVREGHLYSPRFTARYLYREKGGESMAKKMPMKGKKGGKTGYPKM